MTPEAHPMDLIIDFLVLAFLASIAIGLVVALLPAVAFLAGFFGVILICSLVGRLVAGFFF